MTHIFGGVQSLAGQFPHPGSSTAAQAVVLASQRVGCIARSGGNGQLSLAGRAKAGNPLSWCFCPTDTGSVSSLQYCFQT